MFDDALTTNPIFLIDAQLTGFLPKATRDALWDHPWLKTKDGAEWCRRILTLANGRGVSEQQIIEGQAELSTFEGLGPEGDCDLLLHVEAAALQRASLVLAERKIEALMLPPSSHGGIADVGVARATVLKLTRARRFQTIVTEGSTLHDTLQADRIKKRVIAMRKNLPAVCQRAHVMTALMHVHAWQQSGWPGDIKGALGSLRLVKYRESENHLLTSIKQRSDAEIAAGIQGLAVREGVDHALVFQYGIILPPSSPAPFVSKATPNTDPSDKVVPIKRPRKPPPNYTPDHYAMLVPGS